MKLILDFRLIFGHILLILWTLLKFTSSLLQSKNLKAF